MTVTAVAGAEIARGHRITRVQVAGRPIWHCSCGADGRGEPMTGPADLIDALHEEARWKRRSE